MFVTELRRPSFFNLRLAIWDLGNNFLFADYLQWNYFGVKFLKDFMKRKMSFWGLRSLHLGET